ncbi:putative Ser/Thr phosphatase family protein [Blattamonas nauphoetae]|uniref:Ser/Thr phosphatase family protein n=1 Tax=Blattamonas nauphoetae TaxID=2049346 RepID=A0ABQ9Y3G7_9EUKA|nr:putative Ser/Thr phosphatase family protein [Blattamonas nauphoetae]
MKPLTNKNYNWWMRGLVYILFVSREFLIGLCPFCLVMEVVMIIAHCVPISVLLDHGWIAGSICCLGGLGIVGYGLINGTHVHIRRRRIGTYLSSSLRVIHVSDLHSGVRGSGALKRIVSKVNGLRGDMIVMTGDVLDSIALLVRPSEEDRIGGSSRMVENKHYGCRSDETRPLGELFAPLGVFFVTGNHEFYHDIDGVMRTLARYPNIRILDGRVLDLVHNGDPIRLIGLAGNRRSFPATFEIPPFNHPRLVDTDAPLALTTPFTMLLQHQPYKRASVQNMLRSSATVGFFGHTHGGQTFPNWPAVKFGWAASRGRVELKGHREGEGGGSEFVSEEEEWKGKRSRSWLVDGNPSMFVHQGTGTMQAPFRTIGNCSIDVYDFVGQDHDC